MSHRRGESGRSCIICKANSSCFWRRFIEREGKFYAGKSYEWISSTLPALLQAPPGGMYLCNDCYAKNQRAVRKLKPKEFQEKEREYREAAKAKKERLKTGSQRAVSRKRHDYSDDEESISQSNNKRRKRMISSKDSEEDYEESEEDDMEYTPYSTTRSKSRRDGRWKNKDELYSPPKSFDDTNASPEHTSSNEEGNESNDTDEDMRDNEEDEEIAAILSIRLMGEAADFSLKRKLLQRFNNE